MKKILPTQKTNRIESLDLLRGFALLGILLMNITSFSQVGMAYVNPKISAGLDGYNQWFWNFNYLFADTRFMSMFSILFGAGIVLFSNNMASKNMIPAKWHYRRMFWLLIFGLAHAYLIWMGDILVAYAICGALVFLLRNASIKVLIIVGTILFLVPMLISAMTYYGVPPAELEEIFQFYDVSQADIDHQTSSYRSGYFGQMGARIDGALEAQVVLFAIATFWRASSMMILGMILFRINFLSAAKDLKLYGYISILGILLGLSISYIGLAQAHARDWPGTWVMNVGGNYNYLASAFMAVGYMAGLMWIQKKGWFSVLRNNLKLVGRMAFTNYIAMSVIGTFIFYGHGLGLFETFDRLQQFVTVIFIWAIIIIISRLILQNYRQGPLEHLWRILTYGK